MCDPPSPKSKKNKRNKKNLDDSDDELVQLKPPYDRYKDPIKRIKSYNINPNEYSNQGDRKLVRNRESARNSRKRKKIYIELLENKVSELSSELNETKALVFENQKNFQTLCVQSKVNEQALNTKQIFDILENAVRNKQNYSQIQTILESLRVIFKFIFYHHNILL